MNIYLLCEHDNEYEVERLHTSAEMYAMIKNRNNIYMTTWWNVRTSGWSSEIDYIMFDMVQRIKVGEFYAID